MIVNDPDIAALAVIDLFGTAEIGRCLGLLPYDDKHNYLYTSVIEPTVALDMILVRLDRDPRSGHPDCRQDHIDLVPCREYSYEIHLHLVYSQRPQRVS